MKKGMKRKIGLNKKLNQILCDVIHGFERDVSSILNICHLFAANIQKYQLQTVFKAIIKKRSLKTQQLYLSYYNFYKKLFVIHRYFVVLTESMMRIQY